MSCTCPHVERRAGDGLLEDAPALDLSEGCRLTGRRELVGKRIKLALVVSDGDLLSVTETC